MKRHTDAQLHAMSVTRLRAHEIQYQASVQGKGFRLQSSERREVASNRSLISADPTAEIQSDRAYLDLVRRIWVEKARQD